MQFWPQRLDGTTSRCKPLEVRTRRRAPEDWFNSHERWPGRRVDASSSVVGASIFGEMQKPVFDVGSWSLALATYRPYSLQKVQERGTHVLLLHIRLILGRWFHFSSQEVSNCLWTFSRKTPTQSLIMLAIIRRGWPWPVIYKFLYSFLLVSKMQLHACVYQINVRVMT